MRRRVQLDRESTRMRADKPLSSLVRLRAYEVFRGPFPGVFFLDSVSSACACTVVEEGVSEFVG